MINNMYADYYVNTLSENERKFSFKANNPHEVKEWQDEFRQELMEILGIPKIIARGICQLNPVCINTVKLDDHIREEWEITSEPGYRIPFYVLKPLEQKEPLPLVIAVHGHGKYAKDTYVGILHNEEDRIQTVRGERDIALQAVREGYIAIAPDQRGFAKTRSQKDIEEDNKTSCRTMQMHALLFGRTLIGERAYDISRIIDYAATRTDIDSEKIVVTGNSGGGTTTLFAAAVDTRISVAIPSCYFCTFEGSIGSMWHCMCNYVPGIMTLGEMYDVAGLVAPRPFLAVAGRQDHIFPITATEKAFEELCKVYKAAGFPKRCELYVGEGGHRYYKARVWPFVKEWLGV